MEIIWFQLTLCQRAELHGEFRFACGIPPTNLVVE